MKEQKINLGINDGNEFFAHEVSANFNPTQFILDFKCVTPRVDPRSKEDTYINIKHNIVLLDVYHLPKVVELLTNTIQRYEKEFGKIEKPKAIKQFEKKNKKKKPAKKDTSTPSYLG